MDEGTPPGSDDRSAGPRRRRQPDPTAEQKAARQQLADARQKEIDRKKRTRQLIQMGGVCAAFGFDSPEQVEEILAAVTHSRSGPDRLRKLGVRETERWPSGESEWLD